MQSVPIYYEESEPEEKHGDYTHITHISKNQEKDKRWHPEPRITSVSVEVPPEQWIDLFPDEDYGDYESDLREVEKRYNEDHMEFYAANIHDPELIPCAEQFQDTLAELMTAARLIFDKIGKTPEMKVCALAVMNRISKDCYALEDSVSRHAKWMMDRYPDDEVLRSDMNEIDSLFLDFYLDVYNTIGRYKKKRLQ